MESFYLIVCFILPNVFWQLFMRKSISGKQNALLHLMWTYIFFLYCSMALGVAGVGTIWDLIHNRSFCGNINLIPFAPSYRILNILNIMMFMPLGFLLPLIWKRYRNIFRTLLTGFGFSLLIELMQLFNLRVTDVDDLIMNTLGTLAGFLLWFLFSRVFQSIGKRSEEFIATEPLIYLFLGSLGVFLLYDQKIFYL